MTIIQDEDTALEILREVGAWLQETGLSHSKWWDPQNLSRDFLAPYARPEEFYVAMIEGEPAAAAIIQPEQTLQAWSAVDHGAKPAAMYVHYVAVRRKLAGQGLAGFCGLRRRSWRGLPGCRRCGWTRMQLRLSFGPFTSTRASGC